MKKKLLFIIPMILVLFLTACGENKSKKEEGSSSTKTEQKAGKKDKKKNNTHQVGETVKINGVEITVNEGKIGKPDKTMKPQNGKVLRLKITVKNGSKQKVNIDSSQFSLYKKGKPQEEYYGKKAPISGDIEKNKKLSGILKYDVAKPGTYTLVFTPSFKSKQKEIKWKIDVKK